MEPLVSVVIPTYNRSHIVGRAIKSVLAQSYTNFELLVIDDGSEDETSKIIERIADERIRYHKHAQNLGRSQARNTGVRKSLGEFIAFLDSDDEWLPEKLFEQLKYMENAPTAEIGCATAFFRVYLDHKKIIVPQKKDALPKGILFHNILHICTTMLVKREAFEAVGEFDPGFLRQQDTDWLYRCSLKYEIGILNKPLAIFYRDTNRSAISQEKSSLLFYEKYKNEIRKYGSIYYRRKKARLWRSVAYQYAQEKNAKKVRHFATRSILANPFQSMGIYLMLVDSIFGISLKSTADRLKTRVFRKSQSGKGN